METPNAGGDLNSFWTVAGIIASAIVGAVTRSAQWVNPKTGNFSLLLMLAGIAVCLIFGSIVHWVGLEKGIDAWTQIVVTGVFCYVGPDPLIRAFVNIAAKRLGVSADVVSPEGRKQQPKN